MSRSSSFPFLASIYSTARLHLNKAREAEEEALRWALDQYRGGNVGAEARRLFILWDAERKHQLGKALDYRRRASVFRAQLLEMAGEDTVRVA